MLDCEHTGGTDWGTADCRKQENMRYAGYVAVCKKRISIEPQRIPTKGSIQAILSLAIFNSFFFKDLMPGIKRFRPF